MEKPLHQVELVYDNQEHQNAQDMSFKPVISYYFCLYKSMWRIYFLEMKGIPEIWNDFVNNM